MDISISKEAEHLLSILYEEYKRKRDAGVSIKQAKYMNDDVWIQQHLIPKWSLDDVTEVCYALSDNNLLNIFFADDHAYVVSLTDDGIAYAQKKVSRLLDKAQKIKNILPL